MPQLNGAFRIVFQLGDRVCEEDVRDVVVLMVIYIRNKASLLIKELLFIYVYQQRSIKQTDNRKIFT